MAIISLGIIDKKIIYPILGGVFKLIADLAIDSLSKVNKIEMRNHPFLLGFNSGLGFCLSFIPFLIFKRNFDILNHSKEDEGGNLIYNENEDIVYVKRKNVYYQLFAIAFCDFIQKLLSFIYVGLDNFWIFDIPFIILFSLLILKIKLYIHHLVSLVFIIIFGIVLNIIINLGINTNINIFIRIINTFIIEIIFSLEIVISKYVIEFKLCSPYEICLFEGIFELVLNLILLIIFTHIPFSEIKYIKHCEYEGKFYIDNFFQYFSKITFIEVISFIFTLLGRLGFNLFNLLTLKHFPPSFIAICLIIGESLFAVNKEKIIWKIIIEYIIFAFIIFVCLVFLEIIEINLFGMQKNTQKNIRIRAMELDNKPNDDESDDLGEEIELE